MANQCRYRLCLKTSRKQRVRMAGVLLLAAVAGFPAQALAQVRGHGELLGFFVLAAGVVKARLHEVAGRIVDVTGERRAGREVAKVVRFEDGTAVTIYGKTAKEIGLRQGAAVRVTYYEERNGRNIATSVERLVGGARGTGAEKPQVASARFTR